MEAIRSASYAKINLYLKVVGCRLDGMHLLYSYFAKLRLADYVEVYASCYLKCTFTNIPDIDSNIVLKAAYTLAEYCRIKRGAYIRITKNIPIGGGLGGGSSNAATVLKLLNKLWEINLPLAELAHIAERIGADVPFFLYNHHAVVEGIGDKITPLCLPRSYHILLVNPNLRINTGYVFKRYAEYLPHRGRDYNYVEGIILKGRNDLELCAQSLYPELKQVSCILKHQPHCLKVQLSGTGATYFGIFETQESAQAAKHNINQLFPKWWLHYEKLC